MRLKEFSKTFFSDIKSGISRFLIAFICSVLCYLTFAYEIIFETDNFDLIYSLALTFGFVAVLSVFLKLFYEYITDKLNKIIQYILCGIVTVGGFFLIYLNYDSIYTIMVYSGIIIALICFIFFTVMRGENRDKIFGKFVASMSFAWAICIVISIGLSTCISAFQTLIFSGENDFKIYTIVNLFVWIIGYVNIILSSIPKKDVAIQQSKIFKTFVLFCFIL